METKGARAQVARRCVFSLFVCACASVCSAGYLSPAFFFSFSVSFVVFFTFVLVVVVAVVAIVVIRSLVYVLPRVLLCFSFFLFFFLWRRECQPAERAVVEGVGAGGEGSAGDSSIRYSTSFEDAFRCQ